MDLVITRTIKIGGIATDAASVVLRSADGTYGIKRRDTGDVAVAAGVAMAHGATGVYSYTLTDAPPATYDYAIEVTMPSGAVYRATGHATVAPAGTSYLQATEARSLAAALPASWFAPLLALADDQLAAMLAAATWDVDHASRYQGRKYDPTQALEFPRVAFGSTPGTNQFGVPLAGPASLPLTPDTVVWDWNEATDAAVVPDDVLMAVLFQAAWLTNPANVERLEAIRAGVTAQQTGSTSESYGPTAGGTGLGPRAQQMLAKYRLMTGRIL